MQQTNIRNIFMQTLRPRRFVVLVKKVAKRLFDKGGSLSYEENLAWINGHCTRFEILASELDLKLWEEAIGVAAKQKANAEEVLSRIEYDLGGGGCYPFLYFITRFRKPKYVVETGVAAGFSSYAFLEAIKVNGTGRLFSSDFPYFRLPNPERLIGVVVEEDLKRNWTLLLEGDEANLPKIISNIKQIDLFHYDSDKSYSGRSFAMSVVEKKMSKDSIVLMDDIQDNSFFYDYINRHHIENWYIFEFEGKYVGLIGNLKNDKAIPD